MLNSALAVARWLYEISQDLLPGDHIAWNRRCGYFHHAIVTSTEGINCIHITINANAELFEIESRTLKKLLYTITAQHPPGHHFPVILSDRFVRQNTVFWARLNLSSNFFDHLIAPSQKHSGPLAPIPNSKGNPFIGVVKYTGGGKIGDFRSIFDVHRRLSLKRCEIGRWLLWNVNRKSWVPDWMG